MPSQRLGSGRHHRFPNRTTGRQGFERDTGGMHRPHDDDRPPPAPERRQHQIEMPPQAPQACGDRMLSGLLGMHHFQDVTPHATAPLETHLERPRLRPWLDATAKLLFQGNVHRRGQQLPQGKLFRPVFLFLLTHLKKRYVHQQTGQVRPCARLPIPHPVLLVLLTQKAAIIFPDIPIAQIVLEHIVGVHVIGQRDVAELRRLTELGTTLRIRFRILGLGRVLHGAVRPDFNGQIALGLLTATQQKILEHLVLEGVETLPASHAEKTLAVAGRLLGHGFPRLADIPF